jgi:ureidoglycolate dehydrogenase (NAD+)
MRIPISEVKQGLETAASHFVSREEATYFADLYVNTHLRKSPRMSPLNEALTDLMVWGDNAGAAVETIVDKESALLLNFNGLAPSLRLKWAHDELQKRARKYGMAALGFHNSAGITTLSMWAEGLARRDLIGVSMFNGGTECTVPFGGVRGVLGTNPIAYAVPTADAPILLDMATSEIPYFEVRVAKEKGAPLRPAVAIDSRGNPTTVAAEALDDDGVANLLPIGGGFKGYGLMLLVEMLTGPLVRSLLSTEQTSGWNPTEYGCFTLAIDIASFADPAIFKESAAAMCRELRAMPPAADHEAIQIPGDRGLAKLNQAKAEGFMELDDNLVEKLRQLAG